jgi:methyl-accepting chemotaxis protein
VGIEQVSRTLLQMDGSTQQNAALVEEASASARALERQATVLGGAVDAFVVIPTPGARMSAAA